MQIEEKAKVAILIPEKNKLKTKTMIRDKEGPSGSTFGNLSEEIQSTGSRRCVHPYVRCNIIYIDQDMKPACYPSIDKYMGRIWYICAMKCYSDIRGR